MQFAAEDSILLLKLVGGRYYAYFRHVYKTQDLYQPDNNRSQDRVYKRDSHRFPY
jgi:hypothetical protein